MMMHYARRVGIILVMVDSGKKEYQSYGLPQDVLITQPDLNSVEISKRIGVEQFQGTLKDIVLHVQEHFINTPTAPLSDLDRQRLNLVSNYVRREKFPLEQKIQRREQLSPAEEDRYAQLLAMSFFLSELKRRDSDTRTGVQPAVAEQQTAA